MAMLHAVYEPESQGQSIEPLGYIALWQTMRRADSALLYYDLGLRLQEPMMVPQHVADLVMAADVLDPNRDDPDAPLTEYCAVIPPRRLASDFQDIINEREPSENDDYFDAEAILRTTADTLRQLARGEVVTADKLEVATETINAIMQYAIAQCDTE